MTDQPNTPTSQSPRPSRRRFLRGAGAALALPWLESLRPRNASAAEAKALEKPPLRAAFLFMPNGVRPEWWTPPGKSEDLSEAEFPPHLEHVAHLRDRFVLLENLWNENSEFRNGHWAKVPVYLSGGYVVRTSGRDIDIENRSVDQELAAAVGDRTPLPSLQLAVDEAYSGVDNVGGGFARIYGSHIAWRDRFTPLPNEIVPQLAFDRLFRTGPKTPPVSGLSLSHPLVQRSLNRDEASVLDLVQEDAKSVAKTLAAGDKAKLDEYLSSVRSVETRIESALRPQARWQNDDSFRLARPDAGIPEDHETHVRLMLDILTLAFWTDSTRVATFMFGNAQTGRSFGFLDGVSGSFHGLSHHRREEKPLDMYCRVVNWHMRQVAYLIERMDGLSEGDGHGSLLDNAMVLFGSTLKDGNSHDPRDLPLLLAGGGQGRLSPGRRIRYEAETPLCNLYLWMLHQFGVDRDRFGDSTGPLDRLSV